MIVQLIIYGAIAVLAALAIAWIDAGRRWDAVTCSLMGLFWPITLFMSVIAVTYKKLNNKGDRK